MDRLWGQHTVDRFANAAKAHLPRFNSRFRVPGTEVVDAFSISRNGKNNWLVPLVHCITRAVQHLLYAVRLVLKSSLIGRLMCFGLSCSQMQFNSNRTSPRTLIFPTPQGFFPSGVTKIHSLVQTGLTARSWHSKLALRGLSSFTPSGFMLAHAFFHFARQFICSCFLMKLARRVACLPTFLSWPIWP